MISQKDIRLIDWWVFRRLEPPERFIGEGLVARKKKNIGVLSLLGFQTLGLSGLEVVAPRWPRAPSGSALSLFAVVGFAHLAFLLFLE